jgi:hypothetical protein
MNEKLLQYIWQFQLFNKKDIKTTDNKDLKIYLPGNINRNQGPDFLNGKIKIDDTIWFGNVEIHIKSSDWRIHKHSEDKNYKNVMLHVVWEHDEELNLGFPTLCLQTLVPKLLINKYISIMNTETFIPCESTAASIKAITIEKWKERLLTERLQEKTMVIENQLKKSNGNWNEVCWWTLAKSFGGNVNGEAFEAIAQSIPLNILQKHSHSLFSLEAIIIGQSGLLNKKFRESYPNDLFREYLFYKKKYSLRQPQVSLHYLRMRPANFPSVRLAQLCAFIKNETRLISKIIDEPDIEKLSELLILNTSDYWNTHYRIGEPGVSKQKTIGKQTINNIIINTMVVLLYAYGYYHDNEKLKSKALKWMDEIPAEQNNITSRFEKIGFSNHSSFDSQALFQLKNKYCQHKKCLECAIGNEIFRNENNPLITTNYTLFQPANLNASFS